MWFHNFLTTTLHPGTIHVLSLATSLVGAEVELTSVEREGVAEVGLGAEVELTSVVREGVAAEVGLGAEVELTSVVREGVATEVGLGAEVELTSVVREGVAAEVDLGAEVELTSSWGLEAVGVDVQCGPSAVKKSENTYHTSYNYIDNCKSNNHVQMAHLQIFSPAPSPRCLVSLTVGSG